MTDKTPAEAISVEELSLHWPGAPIALDGQHPLRLDDDPGVFLVRRGAVNLFAADPMPDRTGKADGGVCGRRCFLMQLAAGEIFCGLPSLGGRQVLAVGTLDTEVLRAPDAQSHLAGLPDGLGSSLLASWWRQALRAAELEDGTIDDALPLAARSAAIAIALTDRLNAGREDRLQTVADSWHSSGQAMEHGLGRLSELLLSADRAVPDKGAKTLLDSNLVAVVRQVASAAQIDLIVPPELARVEVLDDLLADLQINRRRVLLRDDWWRQDNGPLIGSLTDGRPVALLPTSRKLRARGGTFRYEIYDPALGTRTPISVDGHDSLGREAVMLYRRLPEQAIGGAELLRFGVGGSRSDVMLMVSTGLAAAILAMSMPIATGLLVETIIPRTAFVQHWQIVYALLAAALGMAAFELTKGFATLRIEGRLDASLQAALFDRLLRLPVGFFKRFTAGELGDRALGIQVIRETLSSTITASVLSALFSLVSLTLMFWYSWQLTLIGLAIVLVLVGLSFWLSSYQLRQEREQIRHQGRVEGLVLQFIIGVTKLRAAAAESRAFAVWADAYRAQKQRFANAQRAANVQELVQACIPIFASILLFAAMVWLLERAQIDLKLESLATPPDVTARPDKDPAEAMSVGDMIAFNAAFGQFLQAMMGMTMALARAIGAVPMFERIKPLLEALPEDGRNRQPPGRLKGCIEFADVSFRYLAEGPPLLDRISFRIETGQFVAIVGASGSGKSTLMRLMMGFEIPERGEVFFDGKPLGGLDLVALRRAIGVVLQSGRISAGTVFSNIAGTARISQDEAMEAARRVGLDADIMSMPMGMHTVLQEGGATLSGGQRQRLLLARAIVRKPAILLLDEATSALDNKTQAIVMETLKGLLITRVVIAHRLSTVKDADLILVVRNGHLVEQGNYLTLIAAQGAFAELAKRQQL